jgi:hypothetical protein
LVTVNQESGLSTQPSLAGSFIPYPYGTSAEHYDFAIRFKNPIAGQQRKARHFMAIDVVENQKATKLVTLDG